MAGGAGACRAAPELTLQRNARQGRPAHRQNGGATSSTSNVVFVRRSSGPDFDSDYPFGQVAIDKPAIDWSATAPLTGIEDFAFMLLRVSAATC